MQFYYISGKVKIYVALEAYKIYNYRLSAHSSDG